MHKSPWSKFLGYLIYGFVLCALILVPWMVVEGVISRLPFASELDNLIDKLGVPRSLTRLVLAVPTLVFLGWLLRNRLWKFLQGLPVIGVLLLTTNRVVDRISDTQGTRSDRCVWVSWPNDTVRSIGIVTGEVESKTGERALSVYIFPASGSLRGGMLRIVSPEKVVYPGWTVDETIAFITTGGVVSSGREKDADVS